jgi:sugar phosphate isomerase/epimerase
LRVTPVADIVHEMKRRGFLLGAAGLAALVEGNAAEESPVSIRLAVATYSLRSFQRDLAVKMIKDLRVRYVDIKEFHLPYNDSRQQLAAGRKKFVDAGLEIVAGGNIDMKSEEESELRKSFEYAKTCGMPIMVIAPSRTNLPVIEKLAKEYGIRIAIHNHGPEDKLYPTSQSVLDMVQSMDPLMGLCLDLGHEMRTGADVVKALANAGPRLFEVHIKDLRDAKDKGSQVPVGDGVMPVRAIFQQLRKMNYAGTVSLEFEIDADSPLMGMQKSFSYMRGVIAGMG